jgi:6-phosphogluconolactonase
MHMRMFLSFIVSTNGEFLFEAVYGAGLARIYQLNPTTGEIESLIQELAHDYPLGPHERQEHPHVHFLNETPMTRTISCIKF